MENIKFWIISYYVSLIKASDIIDSIDELICDDIWIDEFIELSSPQYFESKEVLGLLIAGRFKLTRHDFDNYEKIVFSFLYKKLLSKPKAWSNIQFSIVKYFELKEAIFNLTSNKIEEKWFTVIEDYHLRHESIGSIMDMPHDLIRFLEVFNNEDITLSDSIKDMFPVNPYEI